MEPDDVLCEDDFLCRSDDEEDDIEQNASQNADEETGCPVVSLEVPSWLQIDSSGIDEDDYTYLNPFITSSASTKDASVNQSPMKPRVSFRQQTTVYYIPLPTPEEKQAAFYSFDEIAQFRSDAESEVWQQYVDKMMNRPLTNPFNPRSEEEEEGGDNITVEEEGSLPTRALHHDNTVQDHRSQLIRRKISENEDDDENRLEQGIIVQDGAVPATKGWPTNLLLKKAKTKRSTCHHSIRKQSLTLVAGFCILAYFYTR